MSTSNRYLTTILDCMRKDAAESDRQWREDARTRDRQLEALLTRFADGQDTANINASMLQQISKQERKEREEKERKRAIPNPQSISVSISSGTPNLAKISINAPQVVSASIFFRGMFVGVLVL